MTSTVTGSRRLHGPPLPARVPRLARVPRGTIDYGWFVIFGTAAIMFVGAGVGFYGLAVFLRPLQDENGWSNSLVSGATGMYFAVSGLSAALAGRIIDRRGPLGLMAAGVIGMSVGMVLLGRLGEVWHLYAVYGLMAVGFGLTTGTGVSSIIGRWFITRRAQAMSISSTGVSVGGMILVPVGTAMISSGGVAAAGSMLAALVLIVGLPTIAWVLAWDPRQMGAETDLGDPLVVDNANLDETVQHREWTVREATGTGAFWALLVSYVLVLAAQTGFLLHQLSFLEDRMGSRSTASFTLTLTAFGSIVARLVMGRFADRLPKKHLAVAIFTLQGLAVLGLVVVDWTPTTWLFVLIVGFTIGNVYMFQALLVAEVFGVTSFGVVMGAMWLATQAASGFGPFFVGWMDDATGSYTIPFTITGVATLVAAVVLMAGRPPAPIPLPPPTAPAPA